jgi:hypothetical protein
MIGLIWLSIWEDPLLFPIYFQDYLELVGSAKLFSLPFQKSCNNIYHLLMILPNQQWDVLLNVNYLCRICMKV